MCNTIPDEVYAISGLTTGITTARQMASHMPIAALMANREKLVEMQDAAATALQRLDRHIERLGEAGRRNAAQAYARSVA